MFVVEHPRFRTFYEELKQDGFVIGGGDTSGTSSTGDIIPVDVITQRIEDYDIAWPIQVFDEGRMPEISQINIKSLSKYPGDFQQLKKLLSKLIIQETHVETGKKTKMWRLPNEYFGMVQNCSPQGYRDTEKNNPLTPFSKGELEKRAIHLPTQFVTLI
ncbi:MAG: hypothetical protein V1749_00840 [Candidatus Desantisbacteria bacterium]